jgi:hypothetical protein
VGGRLALTSRTTVGFNLPILGRFIPIYNGIVKQSWHGEFNVVARGVFPRSNLTLTHLVASLKIFPLDNRTFVLYNTFNGSPAAYSFAPETLCTQWPSIKNLPIYQFPNFLIRSSGIRKKSRKLHSLDRPSEL